MTSENLCRGLAKTELLDLSVRILGAALNICFCEASYMHRLQIPVENSAVHVGVVRSPEKLKQERELVRAAVPSRES